MKQSLLFVFPFALALQSCIFVVHDDDIHDWTTHSDVVHGSGTTARETREVAPFKRIDLHDVIDVDVRIGEPQSVTVRADDNFISWIETSVTGGTLDIRWAPPHGKGSSTNVSPRVEIVVAALEGLEIEGSGDARLAGLKGPAFQLDIAGSGDVRAEGRVESLSVHVSGSGDAALFGLVAGRVDVSVTGSGDVDVTAREGMRASVTGSGDVRWRGDAKDVSSSIVGSGSVERSGP